MTSDFGFWKQGSGDPLEIFDDLAEGITDRLISSPDVLRFREAIVSRWPDLEDSLEPAAYQLEESPGEDEKFVLLGLARRHLEHIPDIFALADRYGLVGYSGVGGEPIGRTSPEPHIEGD
ncbi:hypothetical protein OHA10_29180 [Kribbella sp. NBC_00662]|uniref:hypothetical protein n=1 Tax=Kribbella sp. NBC_00662 TaxID=2975969 RepID=UPI003249487A